MRVRQPLATVLSALVLVAGTGTGCTVLREQQTVGTYVDDSVITTRVKARFAEDKLVSAMSLTVLTFKGVVQLGGVAKTAHEREAAERLARGTPGVLDVRNDVRVSG